MQDIERLIIESMKKAVIGSNNKELNPRLVLLYSMEFLYSQFEIFQKEEYLRQALLQMQAYVELGFSFESGGKLFEKILDKLCLTKYELFGDLKWRGLVVKATRPQIHKLLRKWNPSCRCMPIEDVIDDIIQKTTKKQVGIYYYWSGRETKDTRSQDVYELTVYGESNIFYDYQKNKYFTICS